MSGSLSYVTKRVSARILGAALSPLPMHGASAHAPPGWLLSVDYGLSHERCWSWSKCVGVNSVRFLNGYGRLPIWSRPSSVGDEGTSIFSRLTFESWLVAGD